MTEVVFVCTENTCRSPIAEAIAKELQDFEFSSAGVHTKTTKINKNVSHALQMKACKIEAKTLTTQLSTEIMDKADFIICLGSNSFESVQKTFDFAKFDIRLLEMPDPHDLSGFSKEDIDKYSLSPQGSFGYTLLIDMMRDQLPDLLKGLSSHKTSSKEKAPNPSPKDAQNLRLYDPVEPLHNCAQM
jgi:protein-tyrosine-phosphatase